MGDKILYISLANFSERISRDWFIDDLINDKYNVEFYDITNIFYKNEINKDLSNKIKIIQINTYKELEDALSITNNETLKIVLLVSLNIKTLKIYRILKKLNTKIIFFEQGSLPKYKSNKFFKLYRILINPYKYFKILFNSLTIKILTQINYIKKYNIVFGVGEKFNVQNNKLDCLYFNINLSDYDQFKLAQNKSNLLNYKYALFLDINAIENPDYYILNMPLLDKESYFNSINNFFSSLEQKFKIKIIIAAHPSTNIENCNYQNRAVIKLNTAVLTKYSEFVITHHSTSISYAILEKKPIISIYTQEMKKIYKNSIIKSIISQTQYLGTKPYNINNFEANNIQLKVNYVLYDKYKYEFITSCSSENKFSKDIFSKNI